MPGTPLKQKLLRAVSRLLKRVKKRVGVGGIVPVILFSHCTHVLASTLRFFVVGRERGRNGDGGGHMGGTVGNDLVAFNGLSRWTCGIVAPPRSNPLVARTDEF